MDPSPGNSGVASQSFDAGRRRALAIIAVGMNLLAGVLVGIPVIGYLLAPLLRPRHDEWIDLGPIDGFPLNQTRQVTYRNPHALPWDGVVDNVAAFVQRTGEQEFRVLAVNCTHLGCPVSWFQESGLFLCPCHGGTYYADGQRASGPPPHGLYEYDVRIDKDRLLVLGGHLPTLQDPMRAS